VALPPVEDRGEHRGHERRDLIGRRTRLEVDEVGDARNAHSLASPRRRALSSAIAASFTAQVMSVKAAMGPTQRSYLIAGDRHPHDLAEALRDG
jgi:hypothetical protein